MERHVLKSSVMLWLPLGQAVVTGLLTGLPAGFLAGLTGWSDPGLTGLLTGAGAALVFWLKLVRHWQQLVTDLLYPDQPEQQPITDQLKPADSTLRLEVVQEGGNFVQYADLQARPEQLVSLARGLMRGQSFSEDSWSGQGRPFSRSQFRALREVMLSRGWLTWRDPEAKAQGLQLTHAGKAVMKYLSDQQQPTTPLYNRWSN